MDDVRNLLAGLAVAAVAGLMMGSAMRPDLQLGDRPEGPQIFTGETAERSTGPFDDGAAFASYRGKAPDYVYGTDWKRQANIVVSAEPEAYIGAEHRSFDADAQFETSKPIPPEPVLEPALG